MKINKTLDIMIASEIFLLAILEYISWLVCNAEDYHGEIKGSDYLIYYYPLFCTGGFLIVALGKITKCYRFKMCIYTIIISWVFLIIQILNMLALFTKFGIELYNTIIYPIFLFTIIILGFIKFIRWGSQRLY